MKSFGLLFLLSWAWHPALIDFHPFISTVEILKMFRSLLLPWALGAVLTSKSYLNSFPSLGTKDISVQDSIEQKLNVHELSENNVSVNEKGTGDRRARIGSANSKESEDSIPSNFIKGCNYDMAEAQRRWELTKRWRTEQQVDGILAEPQPHFGALKSHWPHFYHKRSRKGNNVYYERVGQVDMKALRKSGVTSVDLMVRYYIFQTEWLWGHLDAREEGKTVAVFDMEGVSFKDIGGEPFDFLRKASKLVQENYPERAEAIIILNVPSWFSFLWNLMRPFINEVTQKKIRIAKASENFKALSDFIDSENIPQWYGGQCICGKSHDGDGCRWQSPQEIQLQRFVSQIS